MAFWDATLTWAIENLLMWSTPKVTAEIDVYMLQGLTMQDLVAAWKLKVGQQETVLKKKYKYERKNDEKELRFVIQF